MRGLMGDGGVLIEKRAAPVGQDKVTKVDSINDSSCSYRGLNRIPVEEEGL